MKKRCFPAKLLAAILCLTALCASAVIPSAASETQYIDCPQCGGPIAIPSDENPSGEKHIHYFLPEETCTYGAKCPAYGVYHRHLIYADANGNLIEEIEGLDSVSYYDPLTGQTKECSPYEPVTPNTTALTGGWYVLSRNAAVSNRITVSGNVNLILCDGCTLTAQSGIDIENVGDPSENSLTIWAQSTDASKTGRLIATGTGSGFTGIRCDNSTLTVNGGAVEATGGTNCAGIGGREGGSCGVVNVNGGYVTATGGVSGAGIGGGLAEFTHGFSGGTGGTVTVTGGTLVAVAGSGAEAVGKGGDGNSSGTLTAADGSLVYDAADAAEPVAADRIETVRKGAYVRIEVPAGGLRIKKTVSGEVTKEDAEGALTFVIKKLDGDGNTLAYLDADGILTDGEVSLTLADFDAFELDESGNLNLAVKAFDDIPAGFYQVIETNTSIEGLVFASDRSVTESDPVTVSTGRIAETELIDTYIRTGDLEVGNNVIGTVPEDSLTSFSFKVTLSDTNVSGTFGDMEFENGKAEFYLQHGQSATASGLPAGIAYTVTEDENTGYTVTKTGETGTIQGNTTAKAVFTNTKKTYEITVTANPTNGGTVSGGGTYAHGESAALTASPGSGWIFVNWTKNGVEVSTDKEYSFSAEAAGEYTANFEEMNGHLTARLRTVSTPANGAAYAAGETINYEFTVTNDGNVTITNITASSTLTDTAYNIGSLAPGKSSEPIKFSHTVTEQEAQTGSLKCSIAVQGTSPDPNQPEVLVESCTTEDPLVIPSYVITATANPTDGGTVSGAGSYEHGTELTLTAAPNEKYLFVNWTKDGSAVGTDREYSFTVEAAGEYAANFVKKEAASVVFDGMEDLTYRGQAQNLIGTAAVTGGTISYSLNEAGPFAADIPTGTNADTYTIYYTIEPDDTHLAASGTAARTIKRAQASVTAKASGKTYGQTDPTLEADIEGTVGSEKLNYTLSRAAGQDAGNYPITVTLGDNPNYDVAVTDGTFTIRPADGVTVTVTGHTAAVTYDGAAHTVSGFDTEFSSGLYTKNDFAFTGTAQITGKNAGTEAMGLTEEQFSNASKNFTNVTFEVTDGSLTINRKAAAVTADDKSKVCGEDDPELTAAVEGTVGNDTLSFTLNREEGETVGEYAITVTLGDNPNYDVDVTGGTFTVAEPDKTALNGTIDDVEDFADRIREKYPEVADNLEQAVREAKKAAEDPNVTAEEVKAAQDALREALAQARELSGDRDAFEDYKEEGRQALDEIGEGTPASSSLRQLAETTKRLLDALEYDAEKSYEENIDAVDAVMKEFQENLKALLERERLMELQRAIALLRLREEQRKAAQQQSQVQAPPAPEDKWQNPFIDVFGNDPFFEDVRFVFENGIMNGVADDRFDPMGSLERGMIVTVLYRMEDSPSVFGAKVFTDVPEGEWYSNAVEWAAASGIVNGYGDGRFGPQDPVTREQLAAILYRYAKAKGYDVSVGEDTNILSYDDAFDVADWAMPAMQWACGAGVYDAAGTETALRPQDPATRAEIAQYIHSFLAVYGK
ncbi:MAG: S-layer homology domain-containing protein [Clostridia bacterium]|nr:S-layer homology domain-containing protein [Clostridia bacterium]